MQFAICNVSSSVQKRFSNKVRGTRAISGRRGLSLLEVLIALAIFLAATTIIGQLVSTGSQAAIGAQLKGEAARRCESVLNEAVSGAIPLETTGMTAFEDDPAWSWSLTVGEGPVADLLQIEVRVSRQSGNGRAPTEFPLVRWIRDPDLWTQSTVGGSSSTSSASTGSASGGSP